MASPLNILSKWRQYCHTELQEIARDNNIDPNTKKQETRKVGRANQKVFSQVLWEGGWIDEGWLEKYTMDPATEGDGEVLEGTEDWSLKCFMASCLQDFAEQGNDSVPTCW
jgi:hypothetical protein